MCDVKMSNMRRAYGGSRWNGENNKCIHERCSTGMCAKGVKHGVVEWVKNNTLRWFGHAEGINNEWVKKNTLKWFGHSEWINNEWLKRNTLK